MPRPRPRANPRGRAFLRRAALIVLPGLLAACGNRAPAHAAANAARTPVASPAAEARDDAKPYATDGVQGAAVAAHVVAGERDAEGYLERDWLELLPLDELATLENGPPVLHRGKRRMAQVGSYRSVPGVLDDKVRLPGYVVPLETDDHGRVSEFFLVPYYGACIHVPPPPPNQMVYVRLARPAHIRDMWTAYWAKGVLRAHRTVNAMAGSAYLMDAARLEPYRER